MPTENCPVLVLTERCDATADLVVRELAARGAEVFRCDTAEFPLELTLAARLGSGIRWHGVLSTERRRLPLEEIGAVYVRRPTRFSLPEGMSPVEQRFAAAEARRGLGGVLMSLSCHWVNHPGRVADAEYKPVQLAAAVRCGLRVPSTLITNDPAEAMDFAAANDQLIYKTLSGPTVPEPGRVAVIYTTEVSSGQVDDERVGLTAHLFQERVAKGHDVRVTVAGDRVFAVAIHTEGGVLDWRSCYSEHIYEVIDLPQPVAAGSIELVDLLGLRYAAIDYAVDMDGEYVFLELNPSGQWGWLARACQLPIAAAIADELMSGREITP